MSGHLALHHRRCSSRNHDAPCDCCNADREALNELRQFVESYAIGSNQQLHALTALAVLESLAAVPSREEEKA